jgi:recombination protein RecT
MGETPKTGAVAPREQAITTHKGFDEEVANKVMDYINTLTKSHHLSLPANYNAANALVAAKLHLFELRDKEDKLIIDQCTRGSIVNSLTKMVVNGWNVSKQQCYFIKYKDQLACQSSYMGDLMVAKRDAGVVDVPGQCVYQGDEFEYMVDTKTGRKQPIKHLPKLENQVIDKILGAYALVIYNDGSTKLEVMTIEQIRNAWAMGAAKGKSMAHTQFSDQMCIKTVVARAIKIDLGSSDDSELYKDLVNPDEDQQAAQRDKKIAAKGGKKALATDVPFENIGDPDATSKQGADPNAGKGDERKQPDVRSDVPDGSNGARTPY